MRCRVSNESIVLHIVNELVKFFFFVWGGSIGSYWPSLGFPSFDESDSVIERTMRG